MNKSALIVFGASGFLGRNLLYGFRSHPFDLYGVTRKPQELGDLVRATGANTLAFDQWKKSVTEIIQKNKDVTVINTIGIADLWECEKNPELAEKINKDLAYEIGVFCRDYKIPLVHISTDGLFGRTSDRKTPAYWGIEDAPKTVNVYAKTKLAAEESLKEINWGHCLRLSFVGSSRDTGRGLIAYLAKQIKEAGGEVTGFTDNWFTPVHTEQLCRHLQSIIKKKKTGFFLEHYCSAQAMTKFDYLKQVAHAAGFNAHLTAKVRGEINDGVKSPLDQSLRGENAESTTELIDLSVKSLFEEMAILEGRDSKKVIPYGRQSISEEDIAAVAEVLRSEYLTQGPQVSAFESAFAKTVGAKYAVAVANGTAALHLSALALGVKPGTKVISTPISFAATSNCILYCGGTVVFADIDPKTYLIDLDHVERILEDHPPGTFSGINPVSFTGYPLDLNRLRKIADKHGLWIIEDSCHAPGGYFQDEKKNKIPCGSSQKTELAIFSFHPVKHVATGEGGMITTSDKKLYDKLMLLRSHGIAKEPSQLSENPGGWYYEMQELGYNYRLTDIQAALGTSQLRTFGSKLERRKQIAKRYDQAFKGTKVLAAPSPSYDGHAYHLYVVQVENRKEVYDHLKKKNIFAQVHYIPIHLLPYYKKLGWKAGDFPVAEKYYEKCLSLPMYPTLLDTQQEYVIQCVLEAAK